ncbi:uncharacterized protein MELLADRAFT_60978 [Melampsora larici-populina 98AG31]|uniref:Uncharacterized protein n=1 Tax=Melampsora larici-populina (strain 98AG31 / pathotype 3-4-7) TaxID=747676 RepID=F4RD55_MELLP|nr:uncharacterized protein MELLADRAFT_60978 [Melampsora larici-populina 98AG31]EGG09875.1 hypothetical protein MELLADRAFT_60978 [Melampsora larici-populina 98AG31]
MTNALLQTIVNPSIKNKASQSNKLGEEEESLWLGIDAGGTEQTVHNSSPISHRLIARGSPFADIHLKSPSTPITRPVDLTTANSSDSHISHASSGATTPIVSTVKGTNSPVRTTSKDTIPNRTQGQDSTTGEEFKLKADPVTAVRSSPNTPGKPEKSAQKSVVAGNREKALSTQPQAPIKNAVVPPASSTSSPGRKVDESPSRSTKESTSTPANNRHAHGNLASKDVCMIIASCLVVIGCGIYLLIRKFRLLRKPNPTIRSERLTPPSSGSSKHSITPWVKFGHEKSELSPAALEGGGHHPMFNSDEKDNALGGETTVPDPAYLQARPNLQRRILRRLAGISAATSTAASAAGGRVLESFVRRQVRDDAEARLDGTQGTHSSDKMTMNEKAAKAEAGTGYMHPLGGFATLHNWGSESQYSESSLEAMPIYLFKPLLNPKATVLR